MIADLPIKRDAPLTGAQVEGLRVAVGWDRMAGQYDKILARSYTHFSVMHQGTLIGFLNVISDGIGNAFLTDLMVHPDFRHGEIGRHIVQRAIQDIRADGIRQIDVAFEPHLEPFYRACGFQIIVKNGVIENLTPTTDAE